MLTLPLSAGRDFDASEEAEGGRALILSPGLARDLFHSLGQPLGQSVFIEGLPYRVVGIAPAGFEGIFGTSVKAWVPASSVIPLLLAPPAGMATGDSWKALASFYGLAASDRASSASLAAQVERLLAAPQPGEPTLRIAAGLTADPVRDAMARRWLRLGLLLAVSFCIVSALNYCLLISARAIRYTNQVRLKRALGARTGRLVAELAAGPTALVAMSLLGAAALGLGGLAVISRLSSFYNQLVMGSRAAALLAFGAEVPFACTLTLVIAISPILGLLRDNAAPNLGRTDRPSWRAGRAMQVIITFQIACCLSTWILAGMIVSAVGNLAREPLGYDPKYLTAVSIGPANGSITIKLGPNDSFPSRSSVASLLQAVRALPGVRNATFAAYAPLDSPMDTINVQAAEHPSAVPLTAYENSVGPDYFGTLGTRMIRGSGFTSREGKGDAEQIIINEALAKELWGNPNPVGRTVRLVYPAFAGIPSFSQLAVVAGLVADTRYSGLTESPEPTAYEPLGGGGLVMSYLIVRGSESLRALEEVTSRHVEEQMPGLGVLQTYSVGDRAVAALWREKERAWFSLGGALLMALVAYLGLLGSLTYFVNARKREIAIRICLGALPRHICLIVLKRAVRSAAIAAALTVPLWPVFFLLSSSNYLGQASWSTFRAVLLSLAGVAAAVAISIFPALTATGIAPASELKEE